MTSRNENNKTNQYDYGMDYMGGARPQAHDGFVAAIMDSMARVAGERGEEVPDGRMSVANTPDGGRIFLPPSSVPPSFVSESRRGPPQFATKQNVESLPPTLAMDFELPSDPVEAKALLDSIYESTGVKAEKIQSTHAPPSKCKYCEQSPCFLKQVDPSFDQEQDLYDLLMARGDELLVAGKKHNEIRHDLYRFSIRFCYGVLGKGQRKVVPACIRTEIVDSFPTHRGEEYTGFKKGFLL
jgi:hypothetical protein